MVEYKPFPVFPETDCSVVGEDGNEDDDKAGDDEEADCPGAGAALQSMEPLPPAPLPRLPGPRPGHTRESLGEIQSLVHWSSPFKVLR